jgi:hypothetical protein
LKISKQPLFEKSGAKTFVTLGLGIWRLRGTAQPVLL